MLATTNFLVYFKPKSMNQDYKDFNLFHGDDDDREKINDEQNLPLPMLERQQPSHDKAIVVPRNLTTRSQKKKKDDHQHHHHRRHHSLPCTLHKNPTPIILMSLGRSGTASMYQVLSKLAGNQKHAQRIIEYTGSSTKSSESFFQRIPATDVNGDWLVKYICSEQKRFPNAGIVGFKWKPYETIFMKEKALQGLDLLGRLKEEKGTQIKVIRSKRNLLDVVISRYKHKGNKGNINAHCRKDDEKCVQQHMKASTGFVLPTRSLLSQLKELNDMEMRTDRLLSKMKVPTIHVSFEKLFMGTDASEWTRTFAFLGVGPSGDVSMADVEEASHAATSIPYHNVTLSNYAEVVDVLLGTEFDSLLH